MCIFHLSGHSGENIFPKIKWRIKKKVASYRGSELDVFINFSKRATFWGRKRDLLVSRRLRLSKRFDWKRIHRFSPFTQAGIWHTKGKSSLHTSNDHVNSSSPIVRFVDASKRKFVFSQITLQYTIKSDCTNLVGTKPRDHLEGMGTFPWVKAPTPQAPWMFNYQYAPKRSFLYSCWVDQCPKSLRIC